MPWNEPSRKNNKDSSNKSSGSDGPPDLEEMIKRFLQKLNLLLKQPQKATSGGSGSSGASKHFKNYQFILSFILVLWFLLGIFIVDPAEEAVILLFGKYQTTLGSGPHWIPRFIESAYIVNEQKISTHAYESQMLTKDENIVSVALAIQYRISDARSYLFNVVNPQESLRQATASALRQVIGRTTLDDVLTKGRERVRQEVTVALNSILTRYKTGILVTDVTMQPARAPEEVKEAFDDAIKAQEDEQRYINQAQAYAMQVVPTAKGQAQRILADAKAYKEQVVFAAKGDTAAFLALLPQYQKAPAVTHDRLYLDMMESILTATSKVLINSQGNSMFYLPLDKIWMPPSLSEKPFPFALDKSTAIANAAALEKTNSASSPEESQPIAEAYSQRGH